MFISEIPVRCMSSTGNGEKIIKWIGNLNNHTTVRDVITSILPACDPTKYSLYIHLDRKKQALNDMARIYKIVAKINQQKTSRRLLFEMRSKKRVRFADEILVQNIIQGQCLSNERIKQDLIETISTPMTKRSSKPKRRSSLKVIHDNIPRSEILSIKTKLETLV